MRLVVKVGGGPDAVADGVMLRALGLPGGGTVSVGDTHVRVVPGDVPASEIWVPAHVLENSGLRANAPAEVVRRVVPAADVVRFGEDPGDDPGLLRALAGSVVTEGDAIVIPEGYLAEGSPARLTVVGVEPRGVGRITASTRLGDASAGATTSGAGTRATGSTGSLRLGGRPVRVAGRDADSGDNTNSSQSTNAGDDVVEPEVVSSPTLPVATVGDALLAGLENELDLLTGWCSLLAGPQDLASVWGLPEVAGVLLAGPAGCGKSELVNEAARRAGCSVTEIDATLVFKADKLLEKLSAAVHGASGPTVIHLAHAEAITGDDATSTFRTHAAAILRWLLDTVASTPRLAVVIGISSLGQLPPSLAQSPLLPRSITIPPPDLDRRRALFDAALRELPGAGVDVDRLAASSSGFSGADVLASVVQASSVLALRGGTVDTEALLEAIGSVSPSLGAVPVGEMTSFGFSKVANLEDVKQRLTEAVIWPVSSPERFAQLGIEPPKGVLLYGPPGTGKTFVVKALAHEAGAAFFSVKGAELLDKYVGESERGVRDVFERARAAAPSIIFFDEFDALAPVRGRSSSSVSDSVVAALLTELDGVSERGQIAVIGATNRRDLIDPALLRSGRFEVHIELGLPEQASRRKMLDITDVAIDEAVDLDELAARCDGLSFADMAGLLREAALVALRTDDSAMTVTWEHLETALAARGDGG